MAPMPSHTVEAIHTGRAVAIRGEELSAIGKSPVTGAAEIGPLGLAGDEQADRRVHGGPDMALHHYPRDHYAFWKSLKPDHPMLASAGAFGENISVTGLVEDDVCIGDRFTLGGATVEISQGRQPCWKQGHVMNWPEMVALIVKHARCGWYYRVIESGTVSAGDIITRIESPFPQWTVSRVFSLLIRGEGKSDPAALEALVDLKPLSRVWRGKAAALLGR